MKFKIENISKYFNDKRVLENIDFTFETGKIYGLLGRNGSGKTTLFNCMNRDIRVDGGNFYIEEETGKRDVVTADIGYVLSTPTVPEFLTASEFLTFFIDINRAHIRDLKSLEYYFSLVQIAKSDQDKLLKDYSHGMKNKVQMLINIIAQPNILLLDEPLTSLDVVVAEEMKLLLRGLKQDKVIILSTHLMDLAIDLCDEIVLLHDGKLELIDKERIDDNQLKRRILDVLQEQANA